MAVNTTKTVRYSFVTLTADITSTTSLTTTPRQEFAAIDVDIPETTSRAFLSVKAHYGWLGQTGGKGALAVRTGIRYDGGAWVDTDSTFSGTGETTGLSAGQYVAKRLGASFVTNYTGTTHSIQVALAVATNSSGAVLNGFSCELEITYEFDDTTETRVLKTIEKPFESRTSGFSTQVEIGTNQVEALDTWLPEDNKTFKDVYFRIHGSDGTTGVNHNMTLALDAEGAVSRSNHGTTSTAFVDVWKRYAAGAVTFDTSVAHAFKCANSSGTSFVSFSIVMVITYEYDRDSAVILNQKTVPVDIPIAHQGPLPFCSTVGEQADEPLTVYARFLVNEPGTVTLKRAALMLFIRSETAPNLAIRAGAQADRLYSSITGNVGNHPLGHRLDSGSASGAGMTLARGENEIEIKYHIRSTATLFVQRMVIIVLYTSDRHADGEKVHSRPIPWMVGEELEAGSGPATFHRDYTSPDLPVIHHARWIMTAPPAYLYRVFTNMSASHMHSLWFDRGSNVEPGRWRTHHTTSFSTSGGWPAPHHALTVVDDLFALSSEDTEGFDPTASYRLRGERAYHASPLICYGLIDLLLNISGISFDVEGTLSGFSGDGSGYAVVVRRADTGERVSSATTAVGGGFSAIAFDDTVDYYAETEEGTTKVRSADLAPGGAFNITLEGVGVRIPEGGGLQ